MQNKSPSPESPANGSNEFIFPPNWKNLLSNYYFHERLIEPHYTHSPRIKVTYFMSLNQAMFNGLKFHFVDIRAMKLSMQLENY